MVKPFFRANAADYSSIVVEFVSDDYPDGVVFDWEERCIPGLSGPFASLAEAEAAVAAEMALRTA
jgi:hypothetical protein